MNKGLSADTTLSHYRIVSKLGAGGMGEVYLAEDTRLNRKVAIKLLPADFAADSDPVRRFEQEARAASALNHPNILTVYDIGTHDGAPFIVAELLEGEELRGRLNNGAIPQRKAIEYAQQIVAGLSAAHEKAIVHRDLKPENIFITTDDRVKILDFGLAKLKPSAQAFGADTEAET
ncbi:MAG: serine/threonine protein kinase, partial [Acidobacteria bacterium]|nr:serine/threonine protein kinase [Acidobacteriota bacterium]